jgi:hypothetical protein
MVPVTSPRWATARMGGVSTKSGPARRRQNQCPVTDENVMRVYLVRATRAPPGRTNSRSSLRGIIDVGALKTTRMNVL